LSVSLCVFRAPLNSHSKETPKQNLEKDMFELEQT
jgi:hypothetical protein